MLVQKLMSISMYRQPQISKAHFLLQQALSLQVLIKSKDIVEGRYYALIKANASNADYEKKITITLSAQNTFVDNLMQFIRYYKYYLLAALAILLVFIGVTITSSKRRRRARKPINIRKLLVWLVAI